MATFPSGAQRERIVLEAPRLVTRRPNASEAGESVPRASPRDDRQSEEKLPGLLAHDSLTPFERTLVDAICQGDEADIRPPPGTDGKRLEHSGRADVLRGLCLGGGSERAFPGDIRVKGARIRGRLDLSLSEITHSVRLRDCRLDDGLDLTRARISRPFELDGGRVAFLTGNRLESDADLTLQNLTVMGHLSLHWADIHGDL